MLFSRENTLRSLRNLHRDVLGSMAEAEEVDALWRYSLKEKLNIKVEQSKLDHASLSESNLNTIIAKGKHSVIADEHEDLGGFFCSRRSNATPHPIGQICWKADGN